MIATKVVNQLALVARDGGLVQVIVQHPTALIRELAIAVLTRTPLAWRPAGEGAGALICEVALFGGLTARWHVHGLACPPGWAQTNGDDQIKAELEAGYVLLDLFRLELVSAMAAKHRAEAELN